MRLTDTVECGCECGCERPRDVEEIVRMDAGETHGPCVGELREWARERCADAVREAREEVLETLEVRETSARREVEEMSFEERYKLGITRDPPGHLLPGMRYAPDAWRATAMILKQEIERHEMDVMDWIQEVEPRV